jgi:glycosyltransferase involved in cell wall biosynthesis
MSGALFDLQGVQSRAHGERGVARYLIELAAALERGFPTAVAKYLLNPDLPMAVALESLPPPGRIASVDPLPGGAALYHVGSPFEPGVSIDRLWPRAARGLRLVVTLYDLIPELFEETYLADPPVRAGYRARLGLLRHADRVLAISKSTANDAVVHLGLRADRVVVVGAAPAAMFTPPESREAARAELRRRLPRVEPGFVLYTGGIDFRKNIDRLLDAYGTLDEEIRRAHQLVIVCKVLPEELAVLEGRLGALGIADRVHFTGFVPDEELRLLYGATDLFVFPSLYEGYGLPLAEALACGAPVVASDTSSLTELVDDPQARFDPYDTGSIGATLERFLLEPELRERLRRADTGLQTWDDVAARTAAVYEGLAARPKQRSPRRRPRLAYVSPLPPQWSGIADYSYRLLEPLSGHYDIDAFADLTQGPAEGPPGIHVSPVGNFDALESARSGYDHVLICLGNSEHHSAALDLVQRRGGIVLAHDVRLSGLYAVSADQRPELEPRSFQEILIAMYGAGVPASLLEHNWLDPHEADRHGIFMLREAVAASDCFVVHSEYAANLARGDAVPADRSKIRVAPFAFPDPAQFASSGEHTTVGTFGVVAATKQTDKVLEAFAVVARKRVDATLAIVGPPAGPDELSRLTDRASDLGLADRVRVTGHVDDERFRALVAGTEVAVQLRSVSMGESPASVTDCLAAGTPTIVTCIGAVRELPDDAVLKVRPEIEPEVLARLILAILDDADRREALAAAGRALALERSFEHSADFLRGLLADVAREGAPAAA